MVYRRLLILRIPLTAPFRANPPLTLFHRQPFMGKVIETFVSRPLPTHINLELVFFINEGTYFRYGIIFISAIKNLRWNYTTDRRHFESCLTAWPLIHDVIKPLFPLIHLLAICLNKKKVQKKTCLNKKMVCCDNQSSFSRSQVEILMAEVKIIWFLEHTN